MNKNTPFVLIAILIAAASGYWWFFKQSGGLQKSEPPVDGTVFCPQNAKACPDGSYVSRTGPGCAFAACPMSVPVQSLTLEQVKNTSYIIGSPMNKEIRLTNGVYEEKIHGSASTARTEIYNDKIATGDVDFDGDSDAAIVLTSHTGGTGNFRELAILENKNGMPSYLSSIFLGDRVIVESVSIQSGQIIIRKSTKGGTSCCPSEPKAFVYKVVKGKLQEIKDATTVDTSSWKTYRNEKYGFEVKYPSEWQKLSDDDLGDKSPETMLFRFGASADSENYNDLVFLLTVGKYENLFRDLSDHQLNEAFLRNNYLYTKIDDTTIDGAPAVRFIEEQDPSKIWITETIPVSVLVLTMHNNHSFLFRLSGQSMEIVKEYEYLLDQFISTFKFTE